VDEPRTMPTASASEVETFFASGTPAYPVETSQFFPSADFATRRGTPYVASAGCCAPVDLPGVGRSHACDCPNASAKHGRSTLPGFDGEPGQVSRTLRDLVDGVDLGSPEYRRHCLLSRLLFRARNLAENNILCSARVTDPRWPRVPVSCRECGASIAPDGQLTHRTTCNSGATLRLLAELGALPASDQISEKETAPAVGMARAGVGIRAAGEFHEPWKLDATTNCQLWNQYGDIVHSGDGTVPEEDEPRYARRIAACVNFLAGIPTARLETSRPLSKMGFNLIRDVSALFGPEGGAQ
jgi:hypothetical protein